MGGVDQVGGVRVTPPVVAEEFVESLTSPAISRGRWASWCRVARDPPDQGGCGCLTVATTDQEGHPAGVGYQPTISVRSRRRWPGYL